MLHRTILLADIIEQAPVPTDPKIRKKAEKHIGYPPPGMVHKTAYPAGQGKGPRGPGYDDSYPDTPEGHKLAKAHAWQFPSKRVKAGSKVYRY